MRTKDLIAKRLRREKAQIRKQQNKKQHKKTGHPKVSCNLQFGKGELTQYEERARICSS